MSFADLTQLDARLHDLLLQARAARRDGVPFEDVKERFLGKLAALAGAGRRPGHETLSTAAAYRVARFTIMAELSR